MRRLPSSRSFAIRFFALVASVFLLFGFAPTARADIGGLTPCSETPRFQQRAAAASTDQAKARFAVLQQGPLWHRWPAPPDHRRPLEPRR